MKSFKRPGWQFESHRHSMAAKGIKTSYMAEKMPVAYGSCGECGGEHHSSVHHTVHHKEKKLSARIVPPVVEAGKALPGASRKAGEEHSGIQEAFSLGALIPGSSSHAGQYAEEFHFHQGERVPGESRAAGEKTEAFMVKKSYLAEKKDGVERTSDFLKWVADDGRAQTDDFAHQRKMQEIDVMRNDVVGELQEKEGNGEITFENTQRFLRDDFTDETKDFMDGKIDRATYETNVKRRLAKHTSQHGAKLKLFEGM